jgi:hypothetical protein
MAFTIEALAAELGIEASTLAAKGDVVAKWNGYLGEADGKYRTANETLAQAQREQTAINDQIAKFGVTEARLGELESANAAYKAALETAKKGGFNIDLSGIPQPAASVTVDPNKAFQDQMGLGFRQMGKAMKVQARYQAVYGKPFADDPVALVDEAIAHKMDIEAYAEQKYKFTDETNRRAAADLEAKKAEWQAQAVDKYKEEHPEIPLSQRGMASRHPQVFKPRDAASDKTFRSLPVKERIAQSVARSREALRSAS